MRISSSSSKQMSPGMRFFFSRIFPMIFVVAGTIVVFFGIRGLIRAKASVAWPTTQGKVVFSSVEYYNVTDGNYYAQVIYDFSVNETIFSGDRIAYGGYNSSNPSDVRQVVNRYPKGQTVTVHYMPGNPEECLLEPGVRGQSFLLPGFGLILFAVGGVMAVFLPETMRKQPIRKQGG